MGNNSKKSDAPTEKEQMIAEELKSIRVSEAFAEAVDQYASRDDWSPFMVKYWEGLMVEHFIDNYRPNTKAVYGDLDKIYRDRLNGLSKEERAVIRKVMENCKKQVKEDRTEAELIIETATTYLTKFLRKSKSPNPKVDADEIAQEVFSDICRLGNGPATKQYDPWTPMASRVAFIRRLSRWRLFDYWKSHKAERERIKKFFAEFQVDLADPEQINLAFDAADEKLKIEAERIKRQKHKLKQEHLDALNALKKRKRTP